MSISKIEKRILEISKILANPPIEKEMAGRGIPRHFVDANIAAANKPLLEEKVQLEMERQFLLDRRDSLFWRVIWNILVPVIVSTITVVVLRFVSLS